MTALLSASPEHSIKTAAILVERPCESGGSHAEQQQTGVRPDSHMKAVTEAAEPV